MHAKLHRENTLAGGGKICDYWYVGDMGDRCGYRCRTCGSACKINITEVIE